MAGRPKQETAADVRESMIGQLEAIGANVSLYRSIIDEYMAYFAALRKYKADLRKRGYHITVITKGDESEVPNPSADKMVKCSDAMRKIEKQLGLSPGAYKAADDGGGDL